MSIIIPSFPLNKINWIVFEFCIFFLQLETSNVEILNQQLKDELSLSMADLRFTDLIVQHVEGHDGNDETGTVYI